MGHVRRLGWELGAGNGNQGLGAVQESPVIPPTARWGVFEVVWAVEASRPLVSSVYAQWTPRKGRGPRGGVSDPLELPSGEEFSFSPACLR